ncbi:MAG: hypothetical protein ACRD9Y_01455, partial [Blastocatellia bacterium]
APEHHTPEMRELRHYWGLSRAERAARAEALRQGQLSPSPTLEQMLAELETRRSAQAIRHYQAAILNEKMRNPGKLDLRPMFERLPPAAKTKRFRPHCHQQGRASAFNHGSARVVAA